jgi:hypothetical protein
MLPPRIRPESPSRCPRAPPTSSIASAPFSNRGGGEVRTKEGAGAGAGWVRTRIRNRPPRRRHEHFAIESIGNRAGRGGCDLVSGPIQRTRAPVGRAPKHPRPLPPPHPTTDFHRPGRTSHTNPSNSASHNATIARPGSSNCSIGTPVFDSANASRNHTSSTGQVETSPPPSPRNHPRIRVRTASGFSMPNTGSGNANAPSAINRPHPDVPANAATRRPSARASSPVPSEPERRDASATTTASESAMTMRFRLANIQRRGSVPIGCAKISPLPACAASSSNSFACPGGYTRSRPHGSTATCGHPRRSAARWAPASMPSAPPETTDQPSSSAAATTGSSARRYRPCAALLPTTASRGRGGRVPSSSRCSSARRPCSVGSRRVVAWDRRSLTPTCRPRPGGLADDREVAEISRFPGAAAATRGPGSPAPAH